VQPTLRDRSSLVRAFAKGQGSLFRFLKKFVGHVKHFFYGAVLFAGMFPRVQKCLWTSDECA